jgi:hypothetical protein
MVRFEREIAASSPDQGSCHDANPWRKQKAPSAEAFFLEPFAFTPSHFPQTDTIKIFKRRRKQCHERIYKRINIRKILNNGISVKRNKGINKMTSTKLLKGLARD